MQPFRGAGDAAQAKQTFEAAAKIDPLNGRLLYERGNFSMLTRDFDVALADFGKLIELQPTAFSAFVARSAAYLRMEQLDKALADADAAVAIRASAMTYGVRCSVHLAATA